MKIRGAAETLYVKDIDYNEKGQRKKIQYGNNVLTSYEYDKKTFRLKNILTTSGAATVVIQDLSYTYDPVGNITQIVDHAFEPVFFNNQRTDAKSEYTYDALYRLTEATGREHIGQNSINETGAAKNDYRNFPFVHANDTDGLRNYTEHYLYDAVGNILQMQHSAGTGSWTRNYWYNNNDTARIELNIDPHKIKNNQLLQTKVGTPYRLFIHTINTVV